MLYRRVHALLEDLTRRFHAQDFRGVLSHYDFPVNLTLEDRQLQLARPRELESLLRDHATSHLNAAMVETRFTLSALELPRKGRFRVWVRYHHVNEAGQTIRTSDRILHLRDRGNRLIIEEVAVTRLPFDTMRNWQSSHRLSA
jgi:hypothetical protein